MKQKVFIVEDHPVTAIGYAELIRRAPDLEVCGSAPSAQAALSAITEARPAVALVDLGLPGMSGLELIKQLQAQCPELRILVVSAHDEALYAERALRAGARGYLMKHEAATRVVEAIHRVLQGDLFVSERMKTRFLQRQLSGSPTEAASPLECLSDRELEVFRFIGNGLTTQEIADRMLISPKTVETYRGNIKQKLGLRNTKELMQQAVLWVEATR